MNVFSKPQRRSQPSNIKLVRLSYTEGLSRNVAAILKRKMEDTKPFFYSRLRRENNLQKFLALVVARYMLADHWTLGFQNTRMTRGSNKIDVRELLEVVEIVKCNNTMSTAYDFLIEMQKKRETKERFRIHHNATESANLYSSLIDHSSFWLEFFVLPGILLYYFQNKSIFSKLRNFWLLICDCLHVGILYNNFQQ